VAQELWGNRLNETLLGSIIAAVIAALGTFLLAARRFSGKIATSEAAQLWEEAGRIRRECNERVAALEIKLGTQDAIIQGLREELRRGNRS
jgi:hypothetical protein